MTKSALDRKIATVRKTAARLEANGLAEELRQTLDDLLQELDTAREELHRQQPGPAAAGKGDRPEEALRESEEKFRGVMEQSSDGIAIADDHGIIVEWNRRLEELTGYSKSEYLGRPIWDIQFQVTAPDMQTPQVHAQLKGMILKMLKERESEFFGKSVQKQIHRKDGSVRFVESEIYPIQVGEHFLIGSIMRDISARRQDELAIQESEVRYRALFEDSPVAMWEEDFSGVKKELDALKRDGVKDVRAYLKKHPQKLKEFASLIRVIGVNKTALELYGARDVETLRAFLPTMLSTDHGNDFGEELSNVAEGKTRFLREVVNSTLDGRKITLNLYWSVAPSATEDLSRVIISMADVTNRKQAEAQIDSLSRISDESPNPILKVTPEGVISYANKSSAPLLEAWETRVGTSLPDEWRHQVEQSFASSTNLEVEVHCREQIYSLIIAPIESAGYVNLYGREITKRKKAETELAHQTEELARLYRASGSLISKAPFDLRNLSQTIVTVLQDEFGQANCSVLLVQEGSSDLDRLAVAGPYTDRVSKTRLSLEGPGLVPQAMRTGQLINTPDVKVVPDYIPSWEAARSELAIPLKVGEQVIGAIDIQSVKPGAFNTDDERVMSVFAERAALALEHARLNAQTERRIQSLASLRTIDQAIASSFDINLTLGILLDQVLRVLKASAADILIFNPVTQTLRYSSGQGLHLPSLKRTDLRLGDGHAGRAVRERRMVKVHNLHENPGEAQRAAEFTREGFITYIGLPLVAKGQVKGVLEIFNRDQLDLDHEQGSFLEMLAGQAAIAIDNFQLFDDLQGTNSELVMAYDETIEGWSHAMDLRDQETEGHSQRVTELTLRLGSSLGVSAEDLVHMRRGALLHDIGKIGVPDAILRKPGPLDPDEWEIMKSHPPLA